MKNTIAAIPVIATILFNSMQAKADACDDIRAAFQSSIQSCLDTTGSTCGSGGTTTWYWHTSISRYGKNNSGDVVAYCKAVCDSGSESENVLSPGIPSQCMPELKVQPPLIELNYPNNQCGSIIQAETRVLGEQIPLVGVSFDLNYFTSWVQGRAAEYSVETFLSSINPPALQEIRVWVYDQNDSLITSQIYGGTGNPDFLNASHFYTWDGLDSSSNQTWGRRKFRIDTFAQFLATQGITLKNDIYLGNLKAKKLGLGGWVPSVWMFYDIPSETLIRADGSSRKVTATAMAGGGYQLPEADGSVVYYFDSIGRIVETKTGLTGQTIYSFLYNTNGTLSSITEPFGRTTTFNYNSSGILTSIIAPNGKTTTVTMDANGYLASVTNPKSEVFSMTYVDAGGLLSTFTKPNSAVSTFTYDSDGNLTTDSHSGGASTTITQPAHGSVQLVSSMGRTTNSSTSSTGSYLTQIMTMPDGSQKKTESNATLHNEYFRQSSVSQSFTSDPRFGSQVQSPSYISVDIFGSRGTSYSESATLNSSDPLDVQTLTRSSTVGSNTLTSTFTGSTKTWTHSTVLGRTRTTVLDAYERVTSDQVGNLAATTYSYTDELLTGISQGARSTTLAYNSTTKLLSSITNALSQQTSFTYDSAERLASKILPDLRVIQYTYDFRGNLVSITPPSRPAHVFGMNTKELVGSYDPPALSSIANFSTTYSYNNDKQLTQISRPDGESFSFTYGATNGRLETITTGVGDYTQTYDSNRNPYELTSPNGVKISKSYSYGIVPSGKSMTGPSYAFYGSYSRTPNSNGLVGSESVNGASNGRTVSYTYDYDEYLTAAGDISLTFDTPNGKLAGTVLSNLTDTYTYNTFGEVTGYVAKVGTTTVYSYSLTRDALGRISQKVETLNGITSTFDYTYDSAGRLTQVDKNSTTVRTYSYDSNSNRTGGTINGTTTSATYNDQDWMTAYNVNDYAYSLNGDLQSKTNTLTSATTTYSYDVFGALTQVVTPTKTITYEIDPEGHRFGRKINGTVQTRYGYDFEGRLIAEFDTNGDLTRRYVYASKSNVPDYFIDNTDALFRIVSDHLGSVRLVIEVSTGNVVQRMEHDEFGRVLQDTNPGYTPFGFAGGIYDPDTALVRFGARDYDPETGRWTSKDPILFNGGDSNLYGYVMTDPVNFMDMSGLSPDVITIPQSPVIITDPQKNLPPPGYIPVKTPKGTIYYDPERFKAPPRSPWKKPPVGPADGNGIRGSCDPAISGASSGRL